MAEHLTGSRAVIAKAYLANADQQSVYQWLEERTPASSFEGTIPEDIFQMLLERDLPLIDLALAQFTNQLEVLRFLYDKGDEAVQCAVLSNSLLGDRVLYSDEDIFSGEDEFRRFVESASRDLCEPSDTPGPLGELN